MCSSISFHPLRDHSLSEERDRSTRSMTARLHPAAEAFDVLLDLVPPTGNGPATGGQQPFHLDTRGKENEMGHTPLRAPLIGSVTRQKQAHSAEKVLRFAPFFAILTLPIRCTGRKRSVNDPTRERNTEGVACSITYWSNTWRSFPPLANPLRPSARSALTSSSFAPGGSRCTSVRSTSRRW